MSVSALFSLLAGLAFVLGVMALLFRLMKGVRPDLMGSREDPHVDLLSRRPLAHRQGVAVVRFQGRFLLLSYGEGGVRLLSEEADGEEVASEEERPALGISVPRELREGGGEGSFPRVWARVRKVAGLGGGALSLLALAGFSMGVMGGETFGEDRWVFVPTGEMEILGESPARAQAAEQAGPQGSPGGAAPTTRTAEGAVFGLVRQLPNMDLQVGEGEEGLQLTGPVGTVLFIGFLTLLPTLLLMMTGFTRILVVLHLLKQALGTQTAPPTHLLTAMALLLTGYVMAPTLGEVNRTALTPWLDGQMDELQMIRTASGPFRSFMLESTREEDLATFLDMHGSQRPETVEGIPLVVVTSAFVTSELRHAFQMGFALFLPFVVIDIVVASVLMSMGMFMLPPVMVSLPFKLLLFVLVDGWSLIVGGLVRSFV